MPRADLPSFDLYRNACSFESLGVKGDGESGTIGAPAAIGNAVVDALALVCVVCRCPSSQAIWKALETVKQEGSDP